MAIAEAKHGKTAQEEIHSLELLPKAEAKRRTDALLRNLLSTPPAPFTPKAKPKKRTRK